MIFSMFSFTYLFVKVKETLISMFIYLKLKISSKDAPLKQKHLASSLCIVSCKVYLDDFAYIIQF